MEVNIGISKSDREKIAKALSTVLADTYMLYLKTHNYHWNVKGELFHSLHEQFEHQYTELGEAVDKIAERIRALGHRAPGSFREFSKLTDVEEDTDQPRAMEMVKRLAIANEKVIQACRDALKNCEGEDENDEASIDLLTQRLHVHSKTAWMLRSHLEE